MRHKFQSSTEFIILVSFLLIILIIVQVVFEPFAGIGNSEKEKANNLIWEKSDIAIKNAITEGDNLLFTIQNNLRYEITIYNISQGSTSNTLFIDLKPGESADIKITAEEEAGNSLAISYINRENNLKYVSNGPTLISKNGNTSKHFKKIHLGSATTYFDFQTNGSGTYEGTAQINITNSSNYILDLSNDDGAIAQESQFRDTAMTLITWANLSSSIGGTFGYIVDDSPGATGWGLRYQVSGQNMFFFAYNTDSGLSSTARPYATYLDSWHLISISFTAGNLTMCIDATDCSSLNRAYTDNYTNDYMRIGSQEDSYTSNNFIGELDDFAIYNRALTLEEISYIYNAGR